MWNRSSLITKICQRANWSLMSKQTTEHIQLTLIKVLFNAQICSDIGGSDMISELILANVSFTLMISHKQHSWYSMYWHSSTLTHSRTEKEFSDTNLSLENLANVSTECCWGYVNGCQQRSKVGEDCPSLPVSSLNINVVQQPRISSPFSLLKCSSAGVIWTYRASFSSSSPCPLALPSADVSSQLMGWWLSHACSATADFSIIPLSQASQCSFSLVFSLCLVSPM